MEQPKTIIMHPDLVTDAGLADKYYEYPEPHAHPSFPLVRARFPNDLPPLVNNHVRRWAIDADRRWMRGHINEDALRAEYASLLVNMRRMELRLTPTNYERHTGYLEPKDQNQAVFLRVWFPNNLHNEARDLGRAWITDAARRWEASAVTLEALRAEYQAQLDAWIAASGKRKVSDLARYREAHITQVVPLEYRQPIVRDMLKNPAAFDRVQLWAPGGKKPGLIVFGATGYGKTRAIYNRLATLYRENGTQFYALTADELKQGVIVAAHNGEVEHEATYEYRGDHLPSLRREPSTFEGKLRAADIVFIDDLSQTKMTGYYAERLFALVEHRVARAKPLIVSVQMDGDRLAHKLAGWDEQFADTAACIVRRLRDFCQSVNFGCDPAPP